MKKITILGMGYIGFPTALLLSDAGYEVYGFDVNKDRIKILKKGQLPFEEKGLGELFGSVKNQKSFIPVDKIKNADVFIIAVPTPHTKDKKVDLSYVMNALDAIETVFEKGNLIILESTVGPLDCDNEIIPRIKKFDKEFLFAHVPEKAIPGNTLYEMVQNDRVIGGINEADSQAASKIYSSFVKGKVILTTSKIAAVSKVMENTFRDVNIALANEFAKIAEELNFNVWEAIEIANYHPRVKIHQPGPGAGGHCIPIDPWFLVGESTQTKLIPTARFINETMADYVCRKLAEIIKKHNIKNVVIGILGYAYKKNVDDLRESPAVKVSNILKKQYKVIIHDFYVKNPLVSNNLDDVLSKAQVIVLITDHDNYKKVCLSKYKNLKIIYDTRNYFINKDVEGTDIVLYTLGK